MASAPRSRSCSDPARHLKRLPDLLCGALAAAALLIQLNPYIHQLKEQLHCLTQMLLHHNLMLSLIQIMKLFMAVHTKQKY